MTPPHDPRLDVAGGGLAVRAAKSNAREESFQQIMARELARAPWFMLSLATHALLLLLVNWLIVKPPPGDGSKPWIQLAEKEGEETIEGIATTEDAIQVEKSDGNEPTTEPEIEPRQSFEPAAAELDFDPHGFDNVGFAGIGLMRVRGKKGGKGDGGGDIFALGSDALRKGSLRGTVAKLRDTGLEIVFVFDSTASMSDVLEGAKRRIFRTVEVLHALVPRARIGIVTYRDHDNGEAYLTRCVPVTLDVYRVMNFMHSITAAGGGDFEEAVLDGIRAATTQNWLKNSVRIVVLIGDAPPHKEDENRVRQAVQSFMYGQAYVHTIALGQARGSNVHPDTERCFARIARDGRGQYSPLEGEDTVLQQVLRLAFGNDNRRDLDEVFALVERRTKHVEVAALDAVQRGDVAAITKALRNNPVDDDILKAAITLPNAAVTRFLIEKLGDAAFPPHSRQACAFAVMQILQLRQPPLDPEADVALRAKDVEALLRRL